MVKDLSRFGRNYLQVGYYTEILFPKKGVRFIAINNNVDSATPQDNDFTPFLNIMNEWYAKDTSNKIKAIFKSRMKDGMRCSGSIPYGYKRKPDDKQTLIVDEPAAEVVRKIFRLVCQGNSTTAIAEMLTADKVLIPSAFAESHKDELDSFNKAFRYLKKQGVDLNVNLDSLQAEYDKLKATHTELAGQLATAKEELQPMKDIRYWVSKVLMPEQSEVEKKPEPKHSVTEKIKFLQEQSSNQQEQKTPQQKKQNMEL